MTDDQDGGDLAPVTDLFGARSRRRGVGHVGDRGSAGVRPTADDERGAGDAVQGRRGDDSAHERGHDDALPGGRFSGADRDVEPEPDADAPVPIRRPTPVVGGTLDDAVRGQREQAEWLSPVVGDGSGRSARAERPGYDEPADARTASVFAIDDGSELDAADAVRPLDDQRADAERISMKALGRKGVSASELRTTLGRHDLDADVVEHEIDRLTGVGLLDDLALATDLVDRLHDRKGLGRQGIVAELRRRGIDPATIDMALEAAADDADDEFVRAIELAQKRAGQLRGLDRATAERRLSGFLMRKGYGSGVVRVAVDRALDGPGGRSTQRGSVRFE